MVSVRLSLSRGSLPLCAAGGILLIPLFPLELDGEARTGEREVCRALLGDFFKLPSGSFLRLRCFFDGVRIRMPDGVSSVVTSFTFGLCTIFVPSKSTLLGGGGGGVGSTFGLDSTLTFFAGFSFSLVEDFFRSRLTGLSSSFILLSS